MSSRTPALPQGPTSINAFVAINRMLAAMTVVESRGPVHSTMGDDLPDGGAEVITDDGERWSMTKAPLPAAASDALVILASAEAYRASELPAGPERRTICRQAALLCLLAAALDGKVAS